MTNDGKNLSQCDILKLALERLEYLNEYWEKELNKEPENPITISHYTRFQNAHNELWNKYKEEWKKEHPGKRASWEAVEKWKKGSN